MATNFAKGLVGLLKWAVILLNILTFQFTLKYITTGITEVHNIWNPTLLVFLFTYVTVTIFLGVFDTAITSMVTCLCVDMDLHDGNVTAGPDGFRDDIQEAADVLEAEEKKAEEKARIAELKARK